MRKENKKTEQSKFKNLKGITLATVLAASIIFVQPIFIVNTYAAAIEDCDLDGFDDHTGNPVPWIGFDSTKGEELPSGWDGHTTYNSKKAFEDSQKEDTDTDDKSTSSSSSSSSGSSSSSSSLGSAPNSSSDDSKVSNSSNSSNKSTSNSSKSSSKSKSSSSKSNKSKSDSSKDDATYTSSDNVNNDEAISVDGETETTGNKTTENKKTKKKKSKKKESNTEERTEDIVDENEPIDSWTVLSTKGVIEVNEADGSVIHAGSNLLITGTGFVGNVEDITIEIHSDNPINLASVNTSEDGSFEAQVSIPEELPEGTHEIVVLYQGQQIASQGIEVGPRVANTFIKALTVGFSGDNKGLIPGLLILAGLFVAGTVTVLVGGLLGKLKKQ